MVIQLPYNPLKKKKKKKLYNGHFHSVEKEDAQEIK